jgi:hypothetical protein
MVDLVLNAASGANGPGKMKPLRVLPQICYSLGSPHIYELRLSFVAELELLSSVIRHLMSSPLIKQHYPVQPERGDAGLYSLEYRLPPVLRCFCLLVEGSLTKPFEKW